jgi:hypothetical protein
MHLNASLTAALRRSKLRFRIFASSGWTRRRSRRQRYLSRGSASARCLKTNRHAQVVALLKEVQVVGRQAASKELQHLHDINTVFVRQLCGSAETSGYIPSPPSTLNPGATVSSPLSSIAQTSCHHHQLFRLGPSSRRREIRRQELPRTQPGTAPLAIQSLASPLLTPCLPRPATGS